MRDPIYASIESYTPDELRLTLVPALTQDVHVHRHSTNPTRLAVVIVCRELHELRPLYELLRARFEQEDTPSAGGSPDSCQGPEAAASAGQCPECRHPMDDHGPSGCHAAVKVSHLADEHGSPVCDCPVRAFSGDEFRSYLGRHPQYTDEEEARAEAEHETQICREELEAEDQRREAGRALGAGREQLTDEQVRHYAAGGAR
jgi:hypothetical protein